MVIMELESLSFIDKIMNFIQKGELISNLTFGGGGLGFVIGAMLIIFFGMLFKLWFEEFERNRLG